jgi:hypothetical protein
MTPVPRTLFDAMRHAAEMGHRTAAPERYRWNALWWHLYAKVSACPGEALLYCRNLLGLRRDMLARPNHFARLRPPGMTDYQRSQVKEIEA